MKRWLGILLAMILATGGFATVGSAEEARAALEVTDYIAQQAQVDAALMAECEANYSFENPLVVLNPYGSAPLSAMAIFTTEEAVGGTVTARGRAAEDDVCGRFPAEVEHYVPIYGLYAGDVTEVVLTLDDGRSTTLEIETEPVELSYYSEFEAEIYDAELCDFGGLNFCGLIWEGCYAAFDSKADMRWFLDDTGACGMVFLESGRILVPTGMGYGADGQTGVREIDLLGKVYNEYVWDGGQHHDMTRLPNGNYVVLSNTPGGASAMDYIVEIDPETGEVVWELALDELVRRDDGGAYANSQEDWSHGNAVCYDAESDTLLVSCRNQDGIFGIRKQTKELLWIIGDPEGWEDVDASHFFTPVGENFEWQYGAHCVSLLSDSSVLLFDNGLGGRVKRPSSADALSDAENYSRAVRYRIDVESMTIEQVWSYGAQYGAEYYCSVISGVQCLDEANEAYLINYGSVNPDYGEAPYTENVYGTRIQYVVGDELVWEMSMRGGSYRCYRYDPYFNLGGSDVRAAGQWHGDQGVTPELEGVAADLEGARELPEGVTLQLKPFGALNVSGRCVLQDAQALADSAVVLVDANGVQRAYAFNYTSVAIESGTLVMPKAWVSTNGLPEGTYRIYLLLGGACYDSGVSLNL